MSDDYSLPRNTTEGFAQRVRKNLDFIIQSRAQGSDVHEVTQLAISLLGLIAFPWQAYALKSLEDIPLSVLNDKGWPKWDILLDEKGDTTTLGKLIRHLRNAAAHRRIRFSSDDPELHKVKLQFEDAASDTAPVYWRAQINAAELRVFCERFTKELEELVG